MSTTQVHRTRQLPAALMPRFLPHRRHAFKEVHHARRDQTIEDLGPPLLVVHDSRISQLGKVPGDGRHLGSDQGGQFTHTPLPPRQFIQHEQAPRMSQSLEHQRLVLESGDCRLVGHSAGTFSHVANLVKSFIRLTTENIARKQVAALPFSEGFRTVPALSRSKVAQASASNQSYRLLTVKVGATQPSRRERCESPARRK